MIELVDFCLFLAPPGHESTDGDADGNTNTDAECKIANRNADAASNRHTDGDTTADEITVFWISEN